MANRGLRIIPNGNNRLTRPYARYKSDGTLEDKHRYGVVPIAEFDYHSGEEDMPTVSITSQSGGLVGTSGKIADDQSRIIYNNDSKICAEIYEGNDRSNPYATGTASRGSEKPIGIYNASGLITENSNRAKYREVENYFINGSSPRETSAYERHVCRFTDFCPFRVDSANNNTVRLVRDSNDFTDHQGMIQGVSEWFMACAMVPGSYNYTGAFRYDVRTKAQSQGGQLTEIGFQHFQTAKFVIPAEMIPHGVLKTIGPIYWKCGKDFVETDLRMAIKEGKTGEVIARSVVHGCGGMSGSEEGTIEWPRDAVDGTSRQPRTFADGLIIEFSHDLSKTFKLDAVTCTDSNYKSYCEDGKGNRYDNVFITNFNKSDDESRRCIEYYTNGFSGCSFVEDHGDYVSLNVNTACMTGGNNIRGLRQPKYNGDENIYDYAIRFRGTDSNFKDWDGKIADDSGRAYHINMVEPSSRVYTFESESLPAGFEHDKSTGDVYHIHHGSDILDPGGSSIVYTKNFRIHRFQHCNVYQNMAGYESINPDFKDLSTNDDGCINFAGAKPGTGPGEGGIFSGWRIIDKSGAEREIYGKDVTSIPCFGDSCSIKPIFAGSPITVDFYQATGYDMSTGMEKYADTPTVRKDAKSGVPVELEDITVPVGFECYSAVGWYSGKYGGGQFITYDEKGEHTFYGSVSIYAHFILNTIHGLEWGQITDTDEQWIQPVNDFTGKDNVFFVGRDASRNADTIHVGVRTYPQDSVQRYGQITKITQSNYMFTVTGEGGGKEARRDVTPADATKTSTTDYMVLTAYTNIGIKSQSFVFYVDRIDITLNTQILTPSGSTYSSESLGESPTDAQLTAKFKEKSGGKEPKDGDGLDEEYTPYHRTWVYHSEKIKTDDGYRNWVYMGSTSTIIPTDLGRISDIPKPEKFSIIEGRTVKCVFMGWCDSKGKMYDKDDKSMVFLISTDLYASWVRPEDFCETDMAVLQQPLSKGSYDRMIQLKLIAPTKMDLKYSPAVTPTAVPLQKAENAFVFDTGVVQSINSSLVRQSPSDYDNNSDDTDKWANGKWMSTLIGMVNRYQAETDGEKFLYLPMDVALRRFAIPTEDITGSHHRFAYYGYRYPLVGKCTDKPYDTLKSITELPSTAPHHRIYYISGIDQMVIYEKMDDDNARWHFLMGHDTNKDHWGKGFLYTNAYGDQHYYLGRNVYIQKVDPTYSEGEPTLISFDINMVVGGIKENEEDVIEWL